jgi:DNA-binding winged helix-turn-helix (wHTH) protein
LKKSNFYEYGPFRLDPAEHRLTREGIPVPLAPKAFELLLFLVQNPGRLLSKEQIMQALWAGSFVEEANLTVSISLLRRILGEKDGNVRYIETVPKKGYRFIAPVREGLCPDAVVPETDPSSHVPLAQSPPIWTDSASGIVPPEAARGEHNTLGSLHSASDTAQFSTRRRNIAILALTILGIFVATFVYIAHRKQAASSEHLATAQRSLLSFPSAISNKTRKMNSWASPSLMPSSPG